MLVRSPLFLLVIAYVSGCGKEGRIVDRPVAELKGTIKLEAASIPGGTLQILSEDGKFSCTAMIDQEGHFRTAEAPVGNVKAAVDFPSAPPSGRQPRSPRAKGKLKGTPLTEEGETESPFPEIFRSIPIKYRDYAKSGLKFAVTSGTNEWAIVLKKK